MDNDAILAFQNGMTCTSLIHRLGRCMPRTTRELLDITSNHVDGEEVVTATLNTPQGKGKQVADHGEGNSSHFKKDKRRCDNNLIRAVEHKATRPKSSWAKAGPPKDHFEKLLDASCPNHEVPVKHALKDYRLIKNYVNNTLKPRAADPPKKAAPPPGNNDDAKARYPGEDGAVHMIFGRSPCVTFKASREADLV
jgi:hypothetical protein